MAYATKNGILASLENPAKSHMWNTSFLNNALQPVLQHLQDVAFHHCMFGARRRKRTKLLVNHPCFQHLAPDCDNSHPHDGWGRTPVGCATALEVEYPHGLCKEWALCLHNVLIKHRATDRPTGKKLQVYGPLNVLQSLPNMITSTHVLPATCRTCPVTPCLPAYSKQIQAPWERTWKMEYGVQWTPFDFVFRKQQAFTILDTLSMVCMKFWPSFLTRCPVVHERSSPWNALQP